MSSLTTSPPQPDRAFLYWPAIGGAAVLAVALIAALTTVAAVVQRPRPKPLLVRNPATESGPSRVQPEAAPRAERQPEPAALTDLDPVIPIPAPPSAGLEQLVASAALSVPTAVPSPWTSSAVAPERPAAPPTAARRPVVPCGTSVEFISNPTLAGEHAREDRKLLFLLHVSGDFEDPGFT
jgi:hypothetical protein